MLLRVTANHFIAGIIVRPKNRGNNCAPILSYMSSWTVDKIKAYCLQKGWKVETIPTGDSHGKGKHHKK
jgi:hypothetical protein